MDIFSKGKPQTLEDILAHREERARLLTEIMEEYSGTVLCYKLNIPGPIKNNEYLAEIFSEGRQAIYEVLQKERTRIVCDGRIRSDAGDEWHLVVEDDPQELKRRMCRIEEEHPYGRLFDIDVMSKQSGAVSRKDLGLPERGCLICSRRAVECGRSREHSVQELQQKIHEILVSRHSK
ncbi:MAG: citrate lyase holo-[acyl-carrier protein] synthase [Peptostreptococcaceae bacterium]|nr:citrate lyase holo-[acyl-carrier protein] synthase [Peptostreptococcaceae bacterium]